MGSCSTATDPAEAGAGVVGWAAPQGGDPITAGIVVINPNSSEPITAEIRNAVGTETTVVTSAAGPAAIETDADVAAAVAPLLDTAARHPAAAAYVVACFSDPGLDELRATGTPAFGIVESAIALALEQSERIGVISSVADSLLRHQRYWQRLGVADHIVADVPLGLGVLDLATPVAATRVVAAGEELVAAGAEVVVLGCTGMTHMQRDLQAALGVPVIEPCSAAVQRAREALAETDS